MNRYEKDGWMPAEIQAPIGDRTVITELSEEFSLPDYQPEMKRLLRVRATVLPSDQYVGAGSVECAGRIDYNILYTGNDGALYCTSQSGEYRFATPLELPSDFEIGDGVLSQADVTAEQTLGRVIAPRKVSVKCRLRSRVRTYGKRVLGARIEGDAATERLCGESEYAAVFLGKSAPLQLADEIVCEDSETDLRVICAEGQVFVSENSAGSGSVLCKGEVCLKLLCTHENEAPAAPYVMMRRIPFSHTVTVDGAEVNCEAYVNGVCSDLQITVEDRRILCEVSVELQTKAMRRQRVAYTRDLYSTAVDVKNVYRAVEFPCLIKCANGNMTLNTSLTAEEAGIRHGLELVDLIGSAAVNGHEAEKEKYRFAGKCRFHALLWDGAELSAQEFEAPFRYEIDGGREPLTDCEISAEVISCRGRMDGERIGVDAELAFSLGLCGKREISVLAESAFGEAHPSHGAVCTICYPERSDTLWSVAKRYHCSISELSERNHLASAPSADASDSLAGVRYLVV